MKAYGGEATASTVAGIERVLRKDENHAKKLEDIDPAVAANLLLSNYVLDLAEDYNLSLLDLLRLLVKESANIANQIEKEKQYAKETVC